MHNLQRIHLVALILANAINPTLSILLLVAPFFNRRRRDAPTQAEPWLPWMAAVAVSLALAVVLAEWGKRDEVWPGHSGFPSGHETYGTAAAMGLILRHPRWAIVAVPLAAALGWALVTARFHDGPDIAGGASLGSGVSLGVILLSRVRFTRAASA